MLAENRDEDGLEELDIALGMVSDPEQEALAALAAYQKEKGMVFENPDAPVAGDGKMIGDWDGRPWQ
jgi:hypothetical protein